MVKRSMPAARSSRAWVSGSVPRPGRRRGTTGPGRMTGGHAAADFRLHGRRAEPRAEVGPAARGKRPADGGKGPGQVVPEHQRAPADRQIDAAVGQGQKGRIRSQTPGPPGKPLPGGVACRRQEHGRGAVKQHHGKVAAVGNGQPQPPAAAAEIQAKSTAKPRLFQELLRVIGIKRREDLPADGQKAFHVAAPVRPLPAPRHAGRPCPGGGSRP